LDLRRGARRRLLAERLALLRLVVRARAGAFAREERVRVVERVVERRRGALGAT
jgi:hypothetical protein